MTRRSLLVIQLVGLFLIASSSLAYADSFTFSTIPGTGDVTGPAGSTVGWGYSITNTSSTNWLVLNEINPGVFQNGTPQSIFDFPILAPGQTATVSFDQLNALGLYQLTWDPTAPAGFVNDGVFNLTADFYDGDPTAGGNLLGPAESQNAPYSATVSSPATALPVPSTLMLLAVGLGVICVGRRQKQV